MFPQTRREERRKHPRLERDAPMMLLDTNGRVIDERPNIQNISLCGIALETASAIAAGDNLRIKMELPSGIVSGTVGVCWVREQFAGNTACGLEIKSLDFGHARRLKRFLNSGSSNTLKVFDLFLAAGCMIVFGLIANDLFHSNAAMVSRYMSDNVASLPIYFVIVACAVAIFVSIDK